MLLLLLLQHQLYIEYCISSEECPTLPTRDFRLTLVADLYSYFLRYPRRNFSRRE